MKPTPQLSSNQRDSRRDNRAPGDHGSFPLTDYFFQATVEAPGSASAISENKLRAFRKLSSEFFGAETHLYYIAELFFFILIIGVVAWSITVMMHELMRMMI
jgi:hypothetical protein